MSDARDPAPPGTGPAGGSGDEEPSWGYWDEDLLDRLTRRGDEAPRTNALPPRVEAWRRRTATGALLTGVALGLAEVFEPPPAEVAIVAEAPGEPPGPPRAVTVHLDEDDPSASSVVIRPWLLPNGD